MDFSNLNAEFIVFIAIASPKQEWLAESIYKKVGAKCYCIGGALNMLEGHENCPCNLAEYRVGMVVQVV